MKYQAYCNTILTVVTASSKKEALLKLQAIDVKVTLSDIMKPELPKKSKKEVYGDDYYFSGFGMTWKQIKDKQQGK